jgi:hypothetical protein
MDTSDQIFISNSRFEVVKKNPKLNYQGIVIYNFGKLNILNNNFSSIVKLII